MLAVTLTTVEQYVPRSFTVTLAGTSSLAASVTPYQRITVTLSGQGSLTASVTPYQRITVALTGSAAVAATVTQYQRISAPFGGVASLAATITAVPAAGGGEDGYIIAARLLEARRAAEHATPKKQRRPSTVPRPAGTRPLERTVTLTARLAGHGTLTASVRAETVDQLISDILLYLDAAAAPVY